MYKRLKLVFQIVSVALLITSCASRKKAVYFQDEEGQVIKDSIINFEPQIQVGDLIAINVSAIDAEAALPFNLFETPVLANSLLNAMPITYLVNPDGIIQFPVIGDLEVGGLTTKELNTKLSKILESYIKNPIVNIRLKNFKVTVLGEVLRPGSYPVGNERISIIEAIGMAGDLTIYGERKNVILIREKNGKRVTINIDLTNKQLFNSPYFYLSQNDVIYVSPNKTKINSSAVGPNTSVVISSISIIISAIAIFLR